MLNIAEGFGRGTGWEFCQFPVQARGSAAEAQSILCVALDAHSIKRQPFDDLYQAAEEIGKRLYSLGRYRAR